MRDFNGRLAVISGAGSGIGRALAVALAGEGCHLALCDLFDDALQETASRCRQADGSIRVSTQVCDVADERQVAEFVRHVRTEHGTDHIEVLINNAGISGGGSFVHSSRDEWERTFAICWNGVYLLTRAFLPLLLQSRQGHLVNMASANALRAVLGGHEPHTAYSAAKFAVRGFSEALIHDFRFNAPHLKVSVVMPGHTGTGILEHSARILGKPAPAEQEVQDMKALGMAPEEAARIILDGVRADRWRILLGTDTESLDRLVRESPETAYDPDFVGRWRQANEALRRSGPAS